jgi:hypothetical protein
MTKIDRVFDALINKFHTILGSAWAAALLVYRWKTGNDIGPGLTNVTYVFYGFLLGHAFTYQKYPDQDHQ